MNWTYKNKIVSELPDWCAGFVYEITNTQNGKKYIVRYEALVKIFCRGICLRHWDQFRAS